MAAVCSAVRLQLEGLTPGVMGLPPGPWPVELALKQRSAFGSANSRLVTRCADDGGFCQVPGRVPASNLGGSLGGQTGLTEAVEAGTESLLQGPQVALKSVVLLQGYEGHAHRLPPYRLLGG